MLLSVMTLISLAIVYFPYLSNNIPESPAYGVFVSQLIRYARVCSNIFLFRGSILVSKLMKQGCSSQKLHFYFSEILWLSWGHTTCMPLFTNLTPLCHICWGFCSPTVTYFLFIYSLHQALGPYVNTSTWNKIHISYIYKNTIMFQYPIKPKSIKTIK